MVRGRSKGALRVLAGLVAGLVVAGGAAAAGLPLPRTKAPAFGATNAVAGGKFTTISLDDYKGKYLVLVFYPFDFTYVCPTELVAFSEAT